MPISEPENVSISPKAINTLWCTSPTGGLQTPATSNAQPKLHITTAVASWILLSIGFPLLTEDVVPEAVVLVFRLGISCLVNWCLCRRLHSSTGSGATSCELLPACYLLWSYRCGTLSHYCATVLTIAILACYCHESAFLAEDFARCFLNWRDVSDYSCHGNFEF